MDDEKEREIDTQRFRLFVQDSRWKFAKTYVESYPHEYTLEDWGSAADFSQAILCIERWGIVRPFYSSRRKYLEVDGAQYWHMGDTSSDDPDDQPGLINRSWLDLIRYRDDARRLGYTDEEIDSLVLRWAALLEKARRE